MEMMGCLTLLAFIAIGGVVVIKIINSSQKYDLEVKRLEQEKSNAASPQLTARCEALEKRCTALEEQLHLTQMQLVDEQRALDKKLTHLLPENTSPKQ